jgi:hypothetical protein
LADVLAARDPGVARRPRPADPESTATTAPDDIQVRLKAREAPPARFCWHCRKPLHARSARCPFCGEAQ